MLLNNRGNRCPSPLYNIPSSVPKYGTSYSPVPSVPPIYTSDGYCDNVQTDCTVSHSCTPNTVRSYWSIMLIKMITMG